MIILARRWLGLGLVVLLECLVGRCAAQCSENPVVQPLVGTVMGVEDASGTTRSLLSSPVPIDVVSGVQRDAITVMVGAMLNLTIGARWGGPYSVQNMTLYVYEEPGLPNRAVLDPVKCQRICNPISRQLYWTPSKGQEGKTHSMCFTAYPVDPTLSACKSVFRCIDVTVTAPVVEFDSVTPEDRIEMHSPVGCKLELCMQARDTSGIYDVDIFPVPGGMPPDAQFDVQCAVVPPAAPPVPNPLFPASTLLQQTVECKRCMHWVAPRGFETKSFTPCFTAIDVYTMRERTTCVQITVPKCKYCVQEGDTLHYINKKYRLNSNWLQLWNSNGIGELHPDPLSPTTPFYDPDFISNGNSIINLGPSYSVQKGESLVDLAASFRTTVRKILDTNPDVVSPESVHEGTLLCVMPCTDTNPMNDLARQPSTP